MFTSIMKQCNLSYVKSRTYVARSGTKMTRQETIQQFGLNDGNDEHRYDQAMYLAGMTDRAVWICFRSLVNLEKKGLIELKTETIN